MRKGPAAYIESLLRGRRPRRFRADDADAGMLRTAIELRAARPESGAPSEDFVASLHRRLAEQQRSEDDEKAPVARRRRAVLGGATIAAAGLAAGVGLDRATGSGQSAPAHGGGTVTPAAGVWHSVADVADLSEGAIMPFDTGTYTGFVTRTGGRLRALSAICTHQGCKLFPSGGGLRCPCHGAIFGLDGTPRSHPLPFALPALPRLALRVDAGTVQVYIPA